MASSAIERPAIFTGRGGSGTRLLSQVATAAGIFLGNELSKSGDSVEWVDLVYRMVVEAGCRRDLPTGSRYRRDLRSNAEGILGHPSPGKARPWGFKLPEAMLVLPLLLDAFPDARVVHLVRHPVSSSLRRTHMTSRLDNPVGAKALPAAYRYAGRVAAEIATDDVYLHNAYTWNFQVRRVVQYGRELLGSSRYLEVKYEDLCAEPVRVMETVGLYLGCDGEQSAAAVEVDLSRAGTWDPRDPRVEMIWQICGQTAERLGYVRDPGHRSV